MRPSIALALGVALLTCARPAADPPPETSFGPPLVSEDAFSAERAWEHVRRLTEIGPRASGTPGAARAREYIRGQIEALGLEIASHRTLLTLGDGQTLEIESLIAVLPGESPDLFVLAAPYDTRHFDSFDFVGANAGASGPALLLELARVLTLRPLPYTTWVVFLDGEAPLGRGTAQDATTAWIGSTELARLWASEGKLDSIRLLLYATQVADADLRLARDLRSHRRYRETLWETGERLGHGAAFPTRQSYESPAAGHVPFVARGLRRALLVMDSSFGGDEAPGIYADTEDDTLERCSPASLEAVGEVTLETLEDIGARLAKIDRFAEAPLREPVGPPVPDAPLETPVPDTPLETPVPDPDAPPTPAPDAPPTPAPDAPPMPAPDAPPMPAPDAAP
jgi:hypothetical protein